MNKKEIEQRLAEIITSKAFLEIDSLSLESRLDKDIELDSLDLIEIVMNIERDFNISVPDESVERMRTFGDIVDCVDKILNPNAEVDRNNSVSSGFVDYWGQNLSVGDRITYVGTRGHTPYFQEGVVKAFDDTRKYGDCVQVLGDGNTKPGWTYSSRILKRITL